jgi:GTPase Era involved in 16S rRNA processing
MDQITTQIDVIHEQHNRLLQIYSELSGEERDLIEPVYEYLAEMMRKKYGRTEQPAVNLSEWRIRETIREIIQQEIPQMVKREIAGALEREHDERSAGLGAADEGVPASTAGSVRAKNHAD